jgi:predicted RNA-binding protein with PUA-like domain
MNYWLVKSEPFVFSYEDLVRDGVTHWDGVRNYQARNNLRAMNLGDLCLFYHSNEGLAVVGIARVSKTFYPDPTATSGDWSAVDMAPVKAFTQPVTLAEIKKNPVLSEVGLVKNARLSVMPLRSDEFFTILDMGLTEL